MLRRHASRLGLLVLAVSLYIGAAPAPPVPASSRPRLVQQRQTATLSDTQAAALWLRQRVSRDCPAIDDPALDDWSRVCLLRQWAWQHIPWCSRSLLLDQKPAISLYCRDAPGVFAYLLSDSGGVWCGGAAYALAKLYELYGYPAWTYDYGLPEVMTHVTTVVRIQLRGQRMLVVQDPTFNLTYTAPNGMPLDLATLLKQLRSRQAASVVFQAGDPGQRREFLVAPGDCAAEYWALASQPPHQLL
ncbi:MAG TPA: hypothetical protein VFA18_06885, partial [Gemmataceae bacterium]|nr:hypothetical protein [Gemmataceae bacterium]